MRPDLERLRVADVDADVGGEPLDVRVARSMHVPFGRRISGLTVFRGDFVGRRRARIFAGRTLTGGGRTILRRQARPWRADESGEEEDNETRTGTQDDFHRWPFAASCGDRAASNCG